MSDSGGRFDPDHSDVRRGILPHDAGLVAMPIEEHYLDFLGVLDDVVVCENVSLLIQHRAGAGSLAGDFKDIEAVSFSGSRVDIHDAPVDALVDGHVDPLFRRQGGEIVYRGNRNRRSGCCDRCACGGDW